MTSLLSAAECGDIICLKELIKKYQIDVNKPDIYGVTPLHYVSNNRIVECFRALVYAGANPPRFGQAAVLDYALRLRHTDYVKALLAADRIEVNNPDIWGETPLHHAARKGNIHCLKALLQHQSIKVNQSCSRGMTALHYAVLKGSIHCANLLIQQPDINIQIENNENHTATDIACQTNNKEALTLLQACQPNAENLHTAFYDLSASSQLSVFFYFYYREGNRILEQLFTQLKVEEKNRLLKLASKEISLFRKNDAYKGLDDLRDFAFVSKTMYGFLVLLEKNDFRSGNSSTQSEKPHPNTLFFKHKLDTDQTENKISLIELGEDCMICILEYLLPLSPNKKKKINLVHYLLPMMMKWNKATTKEESKMTNNNALKLSLKN